jgi:hypothetical protein
MRARSERGRSGGRGQHISKYPNPELEIRNKHEIQNPNKAWISGRSASSGNPWDSGENSWDTPWVRNPWDSPWFRGTKPGQSRISRESPESSRSQCSPGFPRSSTVSFRVCANLCCAFGTLRSSVVASEPGIGAIGGSDSVPRCTLCGSLFS